MFNITVEFNDNTSLCQQAKYLKTTDNQMHLFCERGITILIDLIYVENINIYHFNHEEDKHNECINQL